MSQYAFPINGDGRPCFTSNGVRVLFASGCTTQVSWLEPDVLKEKYGAELILDNVKLNPYWQVGECGGAIYKLALFPFDGSEYDYSGLYVFKNAEREFSAIYSRDESDVNALFFSNIRLLFRRLRGILDV